MNTSPTPEAAERPTIDNLADLLREVQRHYTRDDDLPEALLPRIDQILGALDASNSAGAPQPVMEITLRQALSLVGFFGARIGPMVMSAPAAGQGKPE